MINLFNLKNQLIGYAAAALAILLAIFTAFMRGKSAGKQQSQENQQRKDYEAVKQTIEQNNIIDGNDDIDGMRKKLSERLRRK